MSKLALAKKVFLEVRSVQHLPKGDESLTFMPFGCFFLQFSPSPHLRTYWRHEFKEHDYLSEKGVKRIQRVVWTFLQIA